MRALITERFADPTSALATSAGDFALNPSMPRLGPEAVPSAVLVPLIDRAQGMTVLLTQRAEDLDQHPGKSRSPEAVSKKSTTAPKRRPCAKPKKRLA